MAVKLLKENSMRSTSLTAFPFMRSIAHITFWIGYLVTIGSANESVSHLTN